MAPLIGLLINLLVLCLILAVVYWIATLIISAFGAPPIVGKIILAIMGLIILIWLLDILGAAGSGGGLRFYRY